MRSHANRCPGKRAYDYCEYTRSSPESSRIRVYRHLFNLNEQILDAQDASRIQSLCHSCVESMELNLSYDLGSFDEQIEWGPVCERVMAFPDSITDFISVLVAASISSDFCICNVFDSSMVHFLFQLINPGISDDILDGVFSLLIDCTVTWNPLLLFILENIFVHPYISTGSVIQICEFIELFYLLNILHSARIKRICYSVLPSSPFC